MFSKWKYEEGSIELHSGDLIVAYTDGVVEATNSDDEEWGLEGIRKALSGRARRTPQDIVDGIFAALDEYTDGVQTDDATVVALQVS